MSHRRFFVPQFRSRLSLLAGVFLILGSLFLPAAEKAKEPLVHMDLSEQEMKEVSLAYKLLDICLEAAARDVDAKGARPTILARQMSIWGTAVFDAWAAYDEKAVSSRMGDALRRPKREHKLANKEKAIAYASHHAMLFAFPDSKDYLIEEMNKLGYDPSVMSTSKRKPEGIGYLAVQAVIDYRRNDGHQSKKQWEEDAPEAMKQEGS